jgi:hypothetical protein
MDEPTRGFVVVGEQLDEVPAYLLDHEDLLWPPGMPEKRPGEPVRYFKPEDLYRRVRLVEENTYLFVPDTRDTDAVVEAVRSMVRERLRVQLGDSHG